MIQILYELVYQNLGNYGIKSIVLSHTGLLPSTVVTPQRGAQSVDALSQPLQD